MKILCVGGGSMGRRRLRDLTHLGAGDIALFEPNPERCQQVSRQFGVRGYSDFSAALTEEPELMTISAPPALHEPYVRAALDRNLHVFAEVPFVLDLEAMEDVARRARGYRKTIGISAAPRFYPPFRVISDLLGRGEIGKPLYCEYSLGNFLPDWHPYEDYRKFYAGDMRMGGVGLDMIPHEWITIGAWLGPVESVYARLTKLSNLEINGPDNHDVLMTFANGCRGYFHNDVIERGTQGRHIRIVGDQGTIEWHQNLPYVRFYDGRVNQASEFAFDTISDWSDAITASRQVTELLNRQKAPSGKIPTSGSDHFVYESCYLREMKHFVDAVSGKHPYQLATPEEELHSVRTFHAILRSSDEKREVKVGEVSRQ